MAKRKVFTRIGAAVLLATALPAQAQVFSLGVDTVLAYSPNDIDARGEAISIMFPLNETLEIGVTHESLDLTNDQGGSADGSLSAFALNYTAMQWDLGDADMTGAIGLNMGDFGVSNTAGGIQLANESNRYSDLVARIGLAPGEHTDLNLKLGYRSVANTGAEDGNLDDMFVNFGFAVNF